MEKFYIVTSLNGEELCPNNVKCLKNHLNKPIFFDTETEAKTFGYKYFGYYSFVFFSIKSEVIIFNNLK